MYKHTLAYVFSSMYCSIWSIISSSERISTASASALCFRKKGTRVAARSVTSSVDLQAVLKAVEALFVRVCHSENRQHVGEGLLVLALGP
jgi:hypothetical protein